MVPDPAGAFAGLGRDLDPAHAVPVAQVLHGVDEAPLHLVVVVGESGDMIAIFDA